MDASAAGIPRMHEVVLLYADRSQSDLAQVSFKGTDTGGVWQRFPQADAMPSPPPVTPPTSPPFSMPPAPPPSSPPDFRVHVDVYNVGTSCASMPNVDAMPMAASFVLDNMGFDDGRTLNPILFGGWLSPTIWVARLRAYTQILVGGLYSWKLSFS